MPDVTRARLLRRALVPTAMAGLICAGVVVALPDGDDATAGESAAARPIPGQVHNVALTDITGKVAAEELGDAGEAGETGAPARRRKGRIAGVPATATKPFSLLGVTWDEAKRPIGGTVKVRVRNASTGAWSGWRPVEEHTVDGPDPRSAEGSRARGGTAPLWVGPSNGVEVRVAGLGKAIPKGLRVDLVDPSKRRDARTTSGDKGADDSGRSRTPGAAGAAGAAGDASAPRMTLMAASSAQEAAAVSAATADPSAAPSAAPADSSAPVEPSSPATVTEPSTASSPDPGASVAPTTTATASSSASASPAASAAAAVSTAPKPPMTMRSGWATAEDEALVKEPPEYTTDVKAVFVHHTAGANDYSCANSASVVESVFLYHVKSQGWNDIGYHFLVDKCGKLFEGRKGGIDRPVKGAHTYGFNTDTAGIAVLGSYTTATEEEGVTPKPIPGVEPPQAALDTVAKIAAWKLGLIKADPAGTVVLTAAADGKYKLGQQVTLNRISGHRDGFNTTCPGGRLYNKLGGIRTAAKKWVTPATTASLTGISGATAVNGTYYTKTAVTLRWQPSAVTGYEVLRDGAVVAKPGPYATSQTVSLAAGAHKLQVKALNINGTTALSPEYAAVADTTKPVFNPAPALAIRTGTMSSGSVPVRLTWKATDNALLRTLKATSPAAKTFATTTTSWPATTKPGVSTAWTLSAADAAGNATTASIARKAGILADTSSTRSSVWKASSSTSYLGGKALYTGTKGAYASWTFTGRAAGLVMKKASNLGAIAVYVDGVKVTTIDTKATTTAYRQIVWTRTWTASAKHTVKIVVVGTSGRPTVVTDGLVYLA